MDKIRKVLFFLAMLLIGAGLVVGILYTTNWFNTADLYHISEYAIGNYPTICHEQNLGQLAEGKVRITTKNKLVVITATSITLGEEHLDWFENPEVDRFGLFLGPEPGGKTTHYVFVTRCSGQLYVRKVSSIWLDVVEDHWWLRDIVGKVKGLGQSLSESQFNLKKADVVAPDLDLRSLNPESAPDWCSNLKPNVWREYGNEVNIRVGSLYVEVYAENDIGEVLLYLDTFTGFPYLIRNFDNFQIKDGERISIFLDEGVNADVLLCGGKLYWNDWGKG